MAKASMTKGLGDGDYAAHADLHTLIEAEKIRKDGKRHKAAMKKHSEMKKHLNAIEVSPKRSDHDGDEGGY